MFDPDKEILGSDEGRHSIGAVYFVSAFLPLHPTNVDYALRF